MQEAETDMTENQQTENFISIMPEQGPKQGVVLVMLALQLKQLSKTFVSIAKDTTIIL